MTTTGTYTFAIAGMHCSSCTILIDETIEALPGVAQATTHLRRGKCVVELDPARIKPKQIAKVINKLGYKVTPTE